jgi:hypothetical protein
VKENASFLSCPFDPVRTRCVEMSVLQKLLHTDRRVKWITEKNIPVYYGVSLAGLSELRDSRTGIVNGFRRLAHSGELP